MKHGQYAAKVVFDVVVDASGADAISKRAKVDLAAEKQAVAPEDEENESTMVGTPCPWDCGGFVALRKDPRSTHLFYGCTNYGNPSIKCRYHKNDVWDIDKRNYWAMDC